jgi:hypothetical protein
MKRFLAALALPAVLAACATPVAPPPPFFETRISAERMRVTFQGAANPVFAADQALLRAADLTVNEGYEWFVVENRYTEEQGRRGGGPTFSIGGSTFDFGRRGGSSIGAGIGFGLGDLSRPRVASTVEIRMGRGAKPLEAYDARDVLRTLGGRA